MGSIPVGATFYFFFYLSNMIRYLFILLLFPFFGSSAQSLVLISKDKNGEIQKWIKTKHPQVQTVECFGLSKDSLEICMKAAGGLVLGGGEDIHPARYGKEKEIGKCGKIDLYRDTLEFHLLEWASQNKIPTVGICRGMQWLNVFFGGDLMVDLPSDHPSAINHSQFGIKEVHLVKQSATKSQLFDAMQSKEIMVNSSHHQAIGKLSPNFQAVAQSPDGIIEAIEWKTMNDWFAFGIQWHPERLEDLPSKKLLEFFLSRSIDKK